MKTAVHGILTGVCLGAASLAAQTVLDLDVSDNAGLTAGVGGTWDLGSTVLWSADGGATRVPWTDNGAIARMNLATAYGWGSVTLAVDNAGGQVGAAGLRISGNLPDWTYTILQGQPLQLGAAGVVYRTTNPNSYLKFESPVVMTASQTWLSSNARAIDGGGTVQLNAGLTSTGGTTDIVFDGMGRSDPGLGVTSDLRPGFLLKTDNAFSGTTTVGSGAFVWLVFSGTSPGNKLDPASPLVLQGGGVWMNGINSTQQVASVIVKTGTGMIHGRNVTGTFLCGGITRDGLGGVVNFPVHWNGGVTAYTTTVNTDGILGGWATHNFERFATAGTSGDSTAITGLAGTTRSSPNLWGANENIQATGGGTRSGGDVAINSVRITTDAVQDLGTAAVTVKSGGILAANAAGSTISGGTLKTGMTTGELFVHAYQHLTVNSVLSDKDSTPLILVKNGRGRLNITAPPAYTGATYLNSGTLGISGSAALQGTVQQAGGTTLELRDGGSIRLDGETPVALTLGGNLALLDGARLAMRIGEASDSIVLTNPFATFTGAATAQGITLQIADGGSIARQAYPLIRWDADVMLNSVDLTDFSVEFPNLHDGELQFGENCIEVVVTTLPPTATVLLIR